MKEFEVPIIYRSPLITAIKKKRKEQDKLKKDFTPTKIQTGKLTILLARHFGFCYGVENAIEISFKTIEENPGKRIFLLGEMIHNPQVNNDLLSKGVQFLMDTKGNWIIPIEDLNENDIVIIPAFGTTLEIENKLNSIGIKTEKYNTTCPFVQKVWNRAEAIAKKEYSIIVHGKPQHEETRATFSHSAFNTPTIIINDMVETLELAKYIKGEKDSNDFYQDFKGQYSEGFDVSKHLERIGVVNQTTMLASDTQAIADYLKKVMVDRYALSDATVGERFADTRDTLCYATYENQGAVYGLLQNPADLAIVVGGYNSSNTSHLVELCEEKLPTYYIDTEQRIISKGQISHFNFHSKQELVTNDFLPDKESITIMITSGASCPDATVEAVINKIMSFYGEQPKVEELLLQLN